MIKRAGRPRVVLCISFSLTTLQLKPLEYKASFKQVLKTDMAESVRVPEYRADSLRSFVCLAPTMEQKVWNPV